MIPLFGVERETARLRAALEARIADVLDAAAFVNGPAVAAFEARFAARAGARFAVGVSSGRDALLIALAAEGVGPGDAVFVPAFTFTATAEVVAARGAVPIFVDVREEDFAMDPARLAEAVRAVAREGAHRPRAVIPVDLYGLPADYAAIAQALAEAPGPVAVIADAAQSFGGESGGRPVGSLAPVSAFSFYPTKPLGALGDGGALTTDDEALAARWRSIRNCGRGPDGLQHEEAGPTARLDALQAAALLAKLDAFDAARARRREIAARYEAGLDGVVELPRELADRRSAWALYTIRSPRRDALRAALAEAGVATGIYYAAPLPAHPAFRRFAAASPRARVAERLSAEVLSLPMHPDLSDAEVETVCAAVRKAVAI